jgi:WD40 repeat protein
VKLWDTASGKELRAWKTPNTSFSAVTFSPDGKWLAGSGAVTNEANRTEFSFETKLWDPTTGDEVRTLPKEFGLAFSPDGRWLVSSDKTRLKVWDTTTWEEFRTFEAGPASARNVAFSPDSRQLAWALGPIKLWNLQTGILLQEFRGHLGYVNTVSFSPDGRRLASGAADRTVRIWDAKSGNEVLTLKGHTDVVYSVAFSPDGRWLASAGAEAELSGEQQQVSVRAVIRLWDGRPHDRSKESN